MNETVEIEFFLNGKRYAYRSWRCVPRVGDEIMLNFEGEQTAFSVKRVVWGVEADNAPFGRQDVNIEIDLAGG